MLLLSQWKGWNCAGSFLFNFVTRFQKRNILHPDGEKHVMDSCKPLFHLSFALPCPLRYDNLQDKNNVKGLDFNITTEKCAAGSSEQRPSIYQGVLLHNTKIKSLQMYNTRWRRRVISVLWTVWLRWNGLGGKKENIGGDFADHKAAWGRGGVMEWEGSRSRGIPSIRETLLPATEPQRAPRWDLSCCVLVHRSKYCVHGSHLCRIHQTKALKVNTNPNQGKVYSYSTLYKGNHPTWSVPCPASPVLVMIILGAAWCQPQN